MATQKDDIIINSRGCLLKGTIFLILLLKDLSFGMPIPPSYFCSSFLSLLEGTQLSCQIQGHQPPS
jgi:hypothetical protein